jgi:hypothetical protein
MSMKINEIVLSNQKHFVGTCANSFDEDGECIVPLLPWSGVSSFAVDEENAITITKNEFSKITVIPDELKKRIFNHSLMYQKTDDSLVYWIYDDDTDIHYFFA